MAYRWMIATIAGLILLLGIGVIIAISQFGLPGHKALAKRIQALGGETELDESSRFGMGRIVAVSLSDTELGDSEVPRFIPSGTVEEVHLNGLEIGKHTLEHLGRCRKLRSLYVHCTDIADDDLRHLEGLENLDYICIDFTAISDAGLEHLGRCANLTLIQARETHVTERGAEELLTLLPEADLDYSTVPSEEVRNSLVYLSRQGMYVVGYKERSFSLPNGASWAYGIGISPTELGDTATCEHLNRIAAERPTSIILERGSGYREMELIATLPGVYSLHLDSHSISDEDLAPLKFLTDLRKLDLEGCPITDSTMADISELSSLEELTLSYTQASDAGLSHFCKLKHLTRFYLSGQQFGDAGIEYVAKIASLDILELDGCRITDAGLARLGELPRLRVLCLNRCKQLTDNGVKNLEPLAVPKTLRVYGCPGISDEVLEEFEKSRLDVGVDEQ